MTRPLLSLVLLSACLHGSDNDDVVGPFTGETRRFVVDSFRLPISNLDARELGGDLNGDETPDNQLGMIMSTLANMNNVTSHGAEIIASGAIQSTVEITANNFMNDDTVSVKLIGVQGAETTATGGRFTNGVYASNRSATSALTGSTTLHLPVFIHADPSVLPLFDMEIDLVPDGNGGYVATIHGAVPDPVAAEVAYLGAAQMIASYPSEHIGFLGIFDQPPRDWMLTRDEFVKNSLIESLFAPDVKFDERNNNALSFGIGMHLRPCAEGSCLTPTPTCFDRVQNGDETDVDCGGSCHGCVAGETCGDAADCESADCNAGTCGPPSCTNGVHDGFESDTDCGTFCGSKCASGMRCYYNGDCVSGMCGAPCDPDSYWCSSEYSSCY